MGSITSSFAMKHALFPKWYYSRGGLMRQRDRERKREKKS